MPSPLTPIARSGVQKTTLRFDNSLEGLRTHWNLCTCRYSLLQGKGHITVRGTGWGHPEFHAWIFCLPLPWSRVGSADFSQHQHVTPHTRCTAPQGCSLSSVSRDFTGAHSHRHVWLPACLTSVSSPCRRQADSTWPKNATPVTLLA